MNAAVDVVVIGGANTDFLVRGKTLPEPGSTIDVREVSIDSGAATGVALIMVDRDGEKQIMTAPGANRRLSVQDTERVRALISSARIVLLQLEVPLPAVEAAVRLAADARRMVVLDPAPPRELPDDLLRNVHVVRPNAAEAEVLSGVRVTDRKSARKAADELLARGVGAAVVGAPGGNLLVSPDEELWLSHVEVEAVDATGAGDAFVAALAVCLAQGETLSAAVRFANAAAALKTTKLGAQAGLPRREEVSRLLSQSRASGEAT